MLRTVIVTGSTSGIGLGIAQAFANNGCNVMLNGFGDPDDIESNRLLMEAESGTRVLYHPADMTKPDEIFDLVKTTQEKLGSVDVLVNNAGVQHVAPVDEFPPEEWDRIIAINLTSAFHTMRAVIPLMKTAGKGRIINIASAHGLVASPFKSAYVAAKHGIMGLTKSAALELAETGITVNAICPGYVLTSLVEKQIPDTAKPAASVKRRSRTTCSCACRPPRNSWPRKMWRQRRSFSQVTRQSRSPARIFPSTAAGPRSRSNTTIHSGRTRNRNKDEGSA